MNAFFSPLIQVIFGVHFVHVTRVLCRWAGNKSTQVTLICTNPRIVNLVLSHILHLESRKAARILQGCWTGVSGHQIESEFNNEKL
jgi:hypothetical protein